MLPAIPAAAIAALTPLVRLALFEAIQELGKSSAVDRVEFNAAAARAESAGMKRFHEELEAHSNAPITD